MNNAAIMKSLEKCRIDRRYSQIIWNLCYNVTSTVNLNETTNKVDIIGGVRQGDTVIDIALNSTRQSS